MRLYFLSQAFRTPSARRGRITALTHCYVCSPKRKRRRRERKYSLALYHRKIHHLQYDHDRAVTLQPHDDGIGSCCFYDLNCPGVFLHTTENGKNCPHDQKSGHCPKHKTKQTIYCAYDWQIICNTDQAGNNPKYKYPYDQGNPITNRFSYRPRFW